MPRRPDHITRLVALSNVLKTMEEGDEQSILSALQNNAHTIRTLLRQSEKSYRRPFIVHKHQLDTTQPEHFGYGTTEWRERWDKVPRRLKRIDTPQFGILSCTRNLCNSVLAKRILADPRNPRIPTLGVYPEFSIHNNRRCCFVRNNGMRCEHYGPAAVCSYHIRLVKAVPRMNNAFTDSIKSEPLRVAFEKHLNNPDYKNVRSEVALMRTMLDSLVQRIDVQTDLAQIPFAELAAVTQMCQHITNTVEKMASIEQKMNLRLSMDQVTALILTVVNITTNLLQPSSEKMILLAEAIENLPLMQTIADNGAATRDYGCDLKDDGATKLQAQTTEATKFLESGDVINAAFTPEEIKEDKETMIKHFDEKHKPTETQE